jgi:hypothetical protein
MTMDDLQVAVGAACDYGSVSVVPAVLGGLPPGSAPVLLGDSLRIWPRMRVPCI